MSDISFHSTKKVKNLEKAACCQIVPQLVRLEDDLVDPAMKLGNIGVDCIAVKVIHCKNEFH
jgi:hypothetical protein